MVSTRVRWIVVSVLAAVSFFLVTMVLDQARTAARKMSSTNNLKCIGLAMANYSEAHKRFPAGCDIHAKHGWIASIHAYMEASSWYSNLDWDVAWDHPLNLGQFRARMPFYKIPGLVSNYTEEGFSVTHYEVNPALFHKGNYIAPSDFSTGLTQVFLAGEISDGISPCGYPYNWRVLKYPIGSSGSYNGWSNGTHLVMADGRIQWLSNDTDRETVESIGKAYPLPEPEAYERPERYFSLTSKDPPTCIEFLDPVDKPFVKGRSLVSVWSKMDGTAEYIDFVQGHFDCQEVFKSFPDVRVLRCLYPRDSSELERIVGLKNLETLCLMTRRTVRGEDFPSISMDELISGLRRLPKLKFLKMNKPQEGFERLQAELPMCQISESKGPG